MAKQINNPAGLLAYEKQILDLEKKYLDLLTDYMSSNFFKNQLNKLFIELNNDAERMVSLYNGANFLDTPAERFVTYCIYHEFLKRKNEGVPEFETVDCYSYPICGDLAIELSEVVLDIEVKTVSRYGNPGDISSLQFRPNQTSFTNIIKYINTGEDVEYVPKFKIQGNIPCYHLNKPVLTYTVEIIYTFDANDPSLPFKLYSETYHDCTALNIFCIPNGKLGRLFEDCIFQGIKTYTYYDEPASHEAYFDKIKIDTEYFPTLDACTSNVQGVYAYLYNNVDKVNENWKKANNVDYVVMVDTERIGTLSHERQGTLWILTTQKNRSTQIYEPYLRALKSPNSCRIDWEEYLIERYDSTGNRWDGVRHISI